MKKLISLLLVLMTILSASITVFAETYNNVDVTPSTEVTGTYVAGNTGFDTVFCVDIEWEGLAFTYNAVKEPVWNPETHSYSESVAAHWSTGTGTITVTNHSNTPISAAPAFVPDSGYETVALTFSPSNLHLASSEFMEFGANQTGTITVTPTGTLPENTNGKIGVVTVTLAEDIKNITTEEAQALVDVITPFLNRIIGMGLESDTIHTPILEACSSLQTSKTTLNMAINNQNQDMMADNYPTARTKYYELLSLWNAHILTCPHNN